ncbi:MAG TPA: acyl-CoA dehydrogenase family protein [Steroidobacteraceae bacterium]|jgi:acyl-CoA dehydrogenase|nr:acyl-CoA dehydrogenase family protein [Steroidobacteraceae bacterium]
MNFDYSERTQQLMRHVQDFMDRHVYPNLGTYEEQTSEGWPLPRIVEDLKVRARTEGLWNLFMPPWHGAEHVDETFKFECPGLTNVEYAPLAEVMGRVAWAPEVFNCSAPDTGNMEVLQRYATRAQKDQWLVPLMNGEIRSAYSMTEPAVASSDATNIETEIRRDGDEYVINGRKWWSSGAYHPRCELLIVMGKTDPSANRFRQQSMILVPRAAKGVRLVRSTTVYGYPHRGHGGHAEIDFDNVRVPASSILKGEGCGFEIAQGRLGPGRIHHAMRTIGQAEAALEAMCKRLLKRVAFGKPIAQHSVWEERIGHARTEIEMARLLVLKAAYMMDTVGNKAAQAEIAMIKVAAPRMAVKIIDDAVQAHGGAGVSGDFPLAESWANTRLIRLADGPDEVHNRAISRLELKKYM